MLPELLALARLAYPDAGALSVEMVGRLGAPGVIGYALRDEHGCVVISVVHERAQEALAAALYALAGLADEPVVKGVWQ